MKKILYLIFLLLAVVGCDKSITPKGGVLFIDITRKPDRIQDAGIIKDFEVISLKSEDKVIVDKINKIIIHDSLIYIANYRSSSNVVIFDLEGQFVREIKRRGRGPLEYMQLANIFIDETDNTFNIVDRYPAKILKFPLDGAGNPNVISIDAISLDDVMPYSDGYICYTTFSSQNQDKTIQVVDRDGHMVSRDILMRNGWESHGFAEARVFSKFGDKIYFKPIYESPIYGFDGAAKFEPSVALDFGRYNWPPELETADDFLNDDTYLAGDYIGYVHNYQEKESYWLFRYVHRGQVTFAVYDKATGQSMQYAPDVNTDKYLIRFGAVAAITEDNIVTYQDAADVVELLKSDELNRKYPDQMENLRQKVGDLTPESNPVLIVYDI